MVYWGIIPIPVERPRLRHWFSGAAILGALMMAYSVFVASVQMPQEVTTDLRLLLLIVGVVLSLAVWYSLATNNADSERREANEEARFATLQGSVDTLVQLQRARQAVEDKSGPIGLPIIAKLNEQIAALGATVGGLGGIPISLSMDGVRFVTDPKATAKYAQGREGLLGTIGQRLANHPPTTPEAVADAVRDIDEATLVEKAEVKETVVSKIRPLVSDT